MRNATVSHIRPIVRRRDEVVVAWLFRLTLEEDGVSIFGNLAIDVHPLGLAPLATWRRATVEAFIERARWPHPEHPTCTPRCPNCGARKLGESLDHRIGYEERPDFDADAMEP